MKAFTEWVKEHSTCGLTEPLDFSKYGKFIDSWSITVDGITIVNPSLDKVVELYVESFGGLGSINLRYVEPLRDNMME